MSSTRRMLVLSVIATLVGLGAQSCAPVVPALSADVTADPVTGTVPMTTVATATATGGVAPYLYLWTSAPGGVIAAPLQSSTNIVFAIPGEYTVTCRITDSAGQVATDSVTVTVAAPPIVGDAATGLALWEAQCIVCHPSAVDFAPSADNITNDLGPLDPQMTGITLTDQEVADLQAYLNSL